MASIFPSLSSNNPFRAPSNPWTSGNQQATTALPPLVFTPARPTDPYNAQPHQPRPYVPGGHRVPGRGFIDESNSFDSIFTEQGDPSAYRPPRPADQYESVSGYIADHGPVFKALTLNPAPTADGIHTVLLLHALSPFPSFVDSLLAVPDLDPSYISTRLAAKQQMPKSSGPSAYAATGASFAKKKERDHCNNPSCKSPTGHTYPYCISPGGGMAGQTVDDARAKKRADDGRAGGREKKKADNVKSSDDPPLTTSVPPSNAVLVPPPPIPTAPVEPTLRRSERTRRPPARMIASARPVDGDDDGEQGILDAWSETVAATPEDDDGEETAMLAELNAYLCENPIDVEYPDDPNNYAEAMASPDADKWIDGTHEELTALRDKGVYKLVPPSAVPPNKTILDLRAVYTRKRDMEGNVVRNKVSDVTRMPLICYHYLVPLRGVEKGAAHELKPSPFTCSIRVRFSVWIPILPSTSQTLCLAYTHLIPQAYLGPPSDPGREPNKITVAFVPDRHQSPVQHNHMKVLRRWADSDSVIALQAFSEDGAMGLSKADMG
ncbi:hypothetical protein DFH08DRAFT_819008 [Mycena albidolilacea]|uniref:Uncharacterized protein n=1 Tax=Mycena albidolilacea TaxID=1033008 RepID=A0AAD6ZF37_9AGAR|nr:hypothetical protein DFH08DRAFT_819008 [Mycena albidolilacea]